MTYHFCDGVDWHKLDAFEDAYAACEAALAAAVACANYSDDSEWPDWVDQIAVYEAPSETEDPCCFGVQVVGVEMLNVRDAGPEKSCDYICDYRLKEFIKTN